MLPDSLNTTKPGVLSDASNATKNEDQITMDIEQTFTAAPRTPGRNDNRSGSPICPGAPVRSSPRSGFASQIGASEAAQPTMIANDPTLSDMLEGPSQPDSSRYTHDGYYTEKHPGSATNPSKQDDIIDFNRELTETKAMPQSIAKGTAAVTDLPSVGLMQTNSFASGLQDVSMTNNNFGYQSETHSFENDGTHAAQNDERPSSATERMSHEESQMLDVGYEGLSTQLESDANRLIGSVNLEDDPATSFSKDLSNGADQIMELTRNDVEPLPIPHVISADDSVLVADQQRGRLAKYRVTDEEWPPKKRTASVPPRCGDHYSYLANWPPQQPPKCDFGSRVDVFPQRDAPLHLHVQAYALRWGFWAAGIEDVSVRQHVLDTVADKMRDAWENAIGDNYYLRPVAQLDDSDNRNDGEEKAKRGRKRAVSPSKQPAGFVTQIKDNLAVTNGELAQHNLTMEMINKRVQDRDFEAGEQKLDEVLEVLGRDRLVVKDWSKAGPSGSVRGRNLLMYSLYVVLECRYERRKLNNLLASFTRELQKRNTRVRIQDCQEREFQHMALVTELELAQREEQSTVESVEQREMGTEAVDLLSHAEEEDDDDDDDDDGEDGDEDDGESDNDIIVESPVSVAEVTETDENLILEVARSVLSANSPEGLYAAFGQHKTNQASFNMETGLRTGNNQNLLVGKSILGEILGAVTHLISLQQMMQRQQNPSERLKMQHDAGFSSQRILQARDRLAKTLGIEYKGSASIDTKSQSLDANQASSTPQSSEAVTTQVYGLPENVGTSDHAGNAAQEVDFASRSDSLARSTMHAPNMPSQPVVSHGSSPMPQNVSVAGNLGQQTRAPPEVMPQYQQGQPIISQTPLSDSTEDAAAKRVYIDEKWRPWLNSELAKRGQPPYQGIISDWTQLRDMIGHLGFTTADRNILLRQFKAQFDQWSKRRAATHQLNLTAPSPVLSQTNLSPKAQPASHNSPPPGWPSDREVMACIPPSGIHGTNLLRMFQDRVGQYVVQFRQLVERIAFMDQAFMVYPSQQHAAAALQRANAYLAANSGPTGPTPGAPAKRRQTGTSPMQPPAATPNKPHQIVKLKMPQENAAHLPPAQDESSFPEEYKSTEVNTTRGFSFRFLPHSTLEQRRTLDDLVADYVDKTARGRKKNYYGTYITFKDPRDENGPPVAHGFWNFKDGTKPEGSEWFFKGEDVPANRMPKLGLGVSEENNISENQQNAQYRDVYDTEKGQRVRIKFAAPTQGQNQGFNRAQPQQVYNTYPPGHDQRFPPANTRSSYSAPNNQSAPSTVHPSQLTRNQGQASSYARGYLDGNDDNNQESVQPGNATTKKKGTKRAGSATGGGRGSKGKRRKKDVFGDDEDDEDYVPGADD